MTILHEETPELIEHYFTMVNKVVRKRSNKPFKSKSKQNTVIGITLNFQSGYQGFVFKEDDSIVDCRQCVEV